MKYNTISLLVLLLVHLEIEAKTPVKCTPHITQIKNPDDPYSFYKCAASGKPILFKCPARTRFDENLELCNWDTPAGGNGIYETEGYNYARPGSSASGHGINIVTTVDGGIHEIATNQIGIDCSMDFLYVPTKLYQNPYDCTTYYTCNMGRPILTHCPRGLFFNIEIRGCNDRVPQGCQYVDPYKPGGGPIHARV
uniref:Putative chitin binding peritrophin-a domain protein n=1 Tax=Panstrongylus lignarius TaxID=156445 RepID=A0A224XQ56_9HEMI